MSHGHSDAAASTGRLWGVLALVLAYMATEVVAGLATGSLALVADGGHMASDAAAIGLTLYAMRFARRPATSRRTYGHMRAEVIAALVNGATLIGLAVVVIVEAVRRLREPTAVEGGVMLAVAVGGLAVNLVGLWLLRSRHDDNLNVRGAWLHVATDALGSVQVIVAAFLISLFGWTWIDPIASILISVLVIYSSWSLVRQATDVLMEGVPSHLDLDAVRRALESLPGVAGIRDLHVWTISSGFVALSAHVVIQDFRQWPAIGRAARSQLETEFGIRHSTLQPDVDGACEPELHN